MKHFCASANAVASGGKFYCVQGTTLKDGKWDDAVTEGANCKYTQYTGKDTSEEVSFPATCGYNKDAKAFCQSFTGNPFYTAMATLKKGEYAKDYSKKCNKKSTFKNCAATQEWYNKNAKEII